MARRRMVKILGLFKRAHRKGLARACAIANLDMFALRPWQPPEAKDKGLAPDPIRRDRWNRNLTPPS